MLAAVGPSSTSLSLADSAEAAVSSPHQELNQSNHLGTIISWLASGSAAQLLDQCFVAVPGLAVGWGPSNQAMVLKLLKHTGSAV